MFCKELRQRLMQYKWQVSMNVIIIFHNHSIVSSMHYVVGIYWRGVVTIAPLVSEMTPAWNKAACLDSIGMLLAPKTGLSQQHQFANRGTKFFFHGKEKPTSSPELFRATQGKDMLQHNAKHWANQNSILDPTIQVYPPTHLNCWGVKICIPYYSRMFMHPLYGGIMWVNHVCVCARLWLGNSSGETAACAAAR